MATIKTVSVNYERKINLGDFNSAAVGCTLWADVDEDEQDNLDFIMKDLWAMAKENVKAQIEPIARKGNMSLKEYYLGLPKADVEMIEEITNANQAPDGQASAVSANR